jgi:hypothetical protein
MTLPERGALTREAPKRLDMAGNLAARGTRVLLSWLGFVALCMCVAGEEVRRLGKRYPNHIDVDG